MRAATIFRTALLLLFFSTPALLSAQADKNYSRNPHGSLNIPCENCHTNTSWKPIRSIPEFDHNRTRYPLRGMHEKVDCRQCHTNLVFSNVGTRCADCHADIHRRQFGANCEECHTVKGWEAPTQQMKDHQNRFPLLGAHALLQCVDCHKSEAVGQFTGLSTACLSCHVADFQRATEPDHKALAFSTTCESCHGADTWFGAKFDHLKFTGFALTGMHATLDCTACHIGGRFKGTPADCYGCHAKVYNATNNPNHVQAAFPRDCSMCHTTSSWVGATFDHTRFTKFPLTGAHVSVACALCHINGKFVGTPTQCVGCHLPNFQKTTNPNHVQAGFPQQCDVCHTTVAWIPASFNHNNTPFPLTGFHVKVPCNSCHIGGRFAGTPTDCYSCHAKDYNGTTNPNHLAAGFPTTCLTCHTTTSWLGATFNHTWWPLNHGGANGVCSTCHTNPSNYAVFQCTNCHTQAQTDPRHRGVSGYVYNSINCYQCHKR